MLARIRASRRRFLEALAGGAASLLLPRGSAGGSTRLPLGAQALAAGPVSAQHPGFFTDAERAALAAHAERVLPGAAQLGAVEYIEQLLTAFDHDPPRIHAGGPFSGRRPYARAGRASDAFPAGEFENWLPLDRVARRAWRLRLFGSEPGDPLGPVTGLRPLLKEGATRTWSAQGEEFRTRFTELVLEACYADPVYGGNRGEAGWRALGFEGDTLPLGFMPWDETAQVYRERADAPYSKLSSAPDPSPLGLRTRLTLWFLAFLSRRIDLLRG